MDGRSVAVPMICIFGMPGAGKTTVAEQGIAKLVELPTATTPGVDPLGLDLDICVPQWMKDNFAKGLYPTLEQRLEFAEKACDYIDESVLAKQQKAEEEQDALKSSQRITVAIVSFSFVNTDLRDYYRQRFPHAKWVLIDTTESEASRRIEQRQGHFYKGAATVEKQEPEDFANSVSTEKPSTPVEEGLNDEWKFAPVEFEHVILDGTKSITQNSDHVVELIQEMVVNHVKSLTS